MTHAEALDDIERRLDALPKNANTFTLETSDCDHLGMYGVKKKRRRHIAWVRRKINAQRVRLAEQIANKLTGPAQKTRDDLVDAFSYQHHATQPRK